MLTEQQKNYALCEDMFEGDFGDGTERCLSDKIVLGRTTDICWWCGLPTKPKTHHRVTVMLFDGELHRYRYCESCCKAMAASVRLGEPGVIEGRNNLAKKRAARQAAVTCP